MSNYRLSGKSFAFSWAPKQRSKLLAKSSKSLFMYRHLYNISQNRQNLYAENYKISSYDKIVHSPFRHWIPNSVGKFRSTKLSLLECVFILCFFKLNVFWHEKNTNMILVEATHNPPPPSTGPNWIDLPLRKLNE